MRRVYEERVLPRIVDVTLNNDVIAGYRKQACAGLAGVVVEVGFGSGLNVPFYPAAIERVLAIDPSGLGRELARARLDASPVDVEFVGLDGESLPLDDASVDAGLVTFTLCTIPDVDRALAELHRVIKPGGAFHFAEHGRAESSRASRTQDWVNPLWKRCAGGCHLNRQIGELIRSAGFVDVEIERSVAGLTLAGGAVTGSIFCGTARRPA